MHRRCHPSGVVDAAAERGGRRWFRRQDRARLPQRVSTGGPTQRGGHPGSQVPGPRPGTGGRVAARAQRRQGAAHFCGVADVLAARVGAVASRHRRLCQPHAPHPTTIPDGWHRESAADGGAASQYHRARLLHPAGVRRSSQRHPAHPAQLFSVPRTVFRAGCRAFARQPAAAVSAAHQPGCGRRQHQQQRDARLSAVVSARGARCHPRARLPIPRAGAAGASRRRTTYECVIVSGGYGAVVMMRCCSFAQPPFSGFDQWFTRLNGSSSSSDVVRARTHAYALPIPPPSRYPLPSLFVARLLAGALAGGPAAATKLHAARIALCQNRQEHVVGHLHRVDVEQPLARRDEAEVDGVRYRPHRPRRTHPGKRVRPDLALGGIPGGATGEAGVAQKDGGEYGRPQQLIQRHLRYHLLHAGAPNVAVQRLIPVVAGGAVDEKAERHHTEQALGVQLQVLIQEALRQHIAQPEPHQRRAHLGQQWVPGQLFQIKAPDSRQR
eukprot:ctg_196.g59